MMKNFLILILKNLKYRPIRSWLTILGIIIGIMLVVIILSLSGGIKAAVTRTLQMFGSDIIIVFPGKETNPLAGLVGGQKFKEKDLMDLNKINGVRFVVPMNIAVLNVEYKGDKKSTMIHGAPWKEMREIFETSQGMKLEKGFWPENDQVNEVVLGYLAANNLFKNKVQLGDEIIIKSKRMKVAGIFSRVGIQEDDNSMFISMNVFRDLTGWGSYAGSAFIKIEPGADINIVAQQVKFQLQKQEVVRDFSVLTPEKADRLIANVLSIIELVLIIIALVSLVVGAVGIMNTMFTSVLERTKQIGIMKAVGASSEAVLSLFLIESGIIGLIGGILGIILGIIMSYIIGIIANRLGVGGLFSFASLDFFGFFVILIVTFITGIVAGILPARQAAKMEPAEALRYE